MKLPNPITTVVVLAFLVVLALLNAYHAHARERDLRERLELTELSIDILEQRSERGREHGDDSTILITSPPEFDVALQACRERTEHLRDVLETLVRIFPDWRRERLPDPPPGWQAWPQLGAAREWKGTRLPPPPFKAIH